MLGRSLKMAFWVSYDHIGKLILVSMLCSFPLVAPVWLLLAALASGDPGLFMIAGLPAALVGLGILLPVLLAGIAHMVKVLIDARDGSVADTFRGIRLYWRRAIGVGLAYVAALICLPTSVWFYANKLGEAAPWVGYGLSAVALWLLAFAGLSAMFAFPALVQKRGSVGETLKLSGLLVLDNPLFAIGLALQVLAFTAVAIILTPVLFFLYGGMLMALVSSAYEMLSRKYALIEAKNETAQGGERTPAVPDDSEDDYLNRGFRDFLFPWKG